MTNPVTVRFLEAYEYLRERGRVASQKEFAERLDFPESYFPGLRSGGRNIQIQQIANLYIVFGVSLYYVLIGKLPVMEEDHEKELAPELARQLKEAKARLELREKENEELRKLVAFYQKALDAKLK